MKAIPYWVQQPDYSSTEHAAVEVAEALRAFETHWKQERERSNQLEATEREAGLATIGFGDPSSSMLELCPDAQGRATVHYSFMARRKVLGFLPLTLQAVRTTDGVEQSRVLKLIKLFFDGRHDSILDVLGASPD